MSPRLNHAQSLSVLKGKISNRLRKHRSVLIEQRPPKTATESEEAAPPTFYLPPELWRLIFRHVTMISPDPLDLSRGVSFLNSRHCRMRDYRSSMSNKRNLCLVSRLWHELTKEFLFEFVWLCRSRQAQALADTLLTRSSDDGRFIRRVLIETPPLERCNPSDVRIILDEAPNLTVYSDYRSVRRGRRADPCESDCSSEGLLSALAHPNSNLRWLSWTNYDSDISFSLSMSPKLESSITQLEYLELTVCSPDFTSIFSNIFSAHQQQSSSSSAGTYPHTVTLPALRSLKVTLDNATFAMLAKWLLPQLTNLSVMSADFSYAGVGFHDFFLVHGPKLVQLELGHSSSMIEEHYLTAPPHRPAIPLNEYCPNLREFICSADAEWNWTNPDWISPHVLMPSHPKLELIGIKDIDKRLIEDAEVFAATSVLDDEQYFLLSTQLASLLNKEAFPNLRYIRDLSYGSDVMRTSAPQERVSRFWMGVLASCKGGRVWLEDYSGYNITASSLKRARLGLV